MFASIAIDVLTNNLADTYTYHIPEELESYVGIGTRVMVDFGMRKVLGYVIELLENTTYQGDIRDIVDVLDYSCVLSSEQIYLAKIISTETNCSLSKAIDAMFPSFLKTKYRRFLTMVDFQSCDPNISLLFKDKLRIELTSELIKKYPKIKKEIEKGAIKLTYDVYQYGKKKLTKVYSINPIYLESTKDYIGKKKELIEYLKLNPNATLDEIKVNVGCSTYLVNNLVKDTILIINEVYVVIKDDKDRISLKNQQFSFDKKLVKDRFNTMSNKPFLFYTNDEEFSRELYLDIAKDMILKNLVTLIVTPTLILNYNMYNYMKKNLTGFSVLSFSSDMSDSDYFFNYQRVKNDDCEVIITTKVGCMLPINNIGCIIVVDESNFNYISEQTPKYNVVSIMKERAKYHNAKIILASNPLTVENYYNYFQAKYNILKYILPSTHETTLVNMYDEAINDYPIISRTLGQKIKNTLDNKQQVMLILNSKGYSNHLVCRSCGSVATCPKCNIPLTYFKDKDEVKCRYCGSKIESLECSCGKNSYSMLGIGLEMVKEKLNEMFPLANSLIIDSDSLRDYNDFKNIVVQIETKEVDIVLGTNNVLSMNNYGDFSLIGLLQVDNLLNTSDYKASYNTFYLICNAIKTSDVVIQGYNLDHYACKYGVNGDFVSFYNEEIKVRENFNYPPFYEVNRIIITGEFKEMYHASYYMKKVYNTIFNDSNLCLGPTYIKSKRGVQLILKHKDYDKVIKLIGEIKTKFPKLQFNYERYSRNFS